MRKSEKKKQVIKRDRYLKIRVTEEELEAFKKQRYANIFRLCQSNDI